MIDAAVANRGLMSRLLDDLLAIRWMLEPQIARAAAESAEPADIDAMRACVESMDALIDQPAVFFEQDVRFHRTVLAGTHNVVLERIFDPVQALLHTSKERVIAVTSPASRRESNRGHGEILRAVERRDGEAAEARLRMHLKLTTRELELANQTVLRPQPKARREHAVVDENRGAE